MPATAASQPITLEGYRAACERLIRSRAMHLDQLADKLHEPRVRRVIAVLLAGEETELCFAEDDLQYIADLGLIERKPELRISNRLYREVIPREITAPIQDGIHQERGWYLTGEHKLNRVKLLEAFQQFFRERQAQAAGMVTSQ